MYLTIKETAEFIQIPEAIIKSMILQKKIRAVFDGEQYLVYKDQFTTHMEQLETYRKMVEQYLSEPLPEDWDAKDED